MDVGIVRQFYSGPLGAIVLQDPQATQNATVYLQWAKLRHFQYPDLDGTALNNIRTLYPATVILEFIVMGADGNPMRSDVLTSMGLRGTRPVPVSRTWGQFLEDIWLYDKSVTPWPFRFSINGHPWHLVDQSLEAVLQESYPQNTDDPEKENTVQVHLHKRSDSAIDLMRHIPCIWNPRQNHWDPDEINKHASRAAMTEFERREVPGQMEQWMTNPTHAIDDGLMLIEYQWGFTYIKTFWRWYTHAGTMNTHIHVKLLIQAILHFGPQNVPNGVWDILYLSKFPTLHLVLETCPCAYMHLPLRLQQNLNLVRHLLLHHGHMYAMIPKSLQNNSGLLLLATQSSPMLYEARLHEIISQRVYINTHPVVQIVTAEGSGKWWPWVDQQRGLLGDSMRSRPY